MGNCLMGLHIIPSANILPATWCNSGSPSGYSPTRLDQLIISATNLFFVGSLAGKARNIIKTLPVTKSPDQRVLHASANPKQDKSQTLFSNSPLLPRFPKDIHQKHCEVPTTAPLASSQQRQSSTIKEIDGRVPRFGLDIARSDDAELLMSFVELAFGDPTRVRVR